MVRNAFFGSSGRNEPWYLTVPLLLRPASFQPMLERKRGLLTQNGIRKMSGFVGNVPVTTDREAYSLRLYRCDSMEHDNL